MHLGHQNYKRTAEQPAFRTTWNLGEQESCNYGYKEGTTSRLLGGAETWNRLVSHSCWQIKIRRDILAAENPAEEQEVPAPH